MSKAEAKTELQELIDQQKALDEKIKTLRAAEKGDVVAKIKKQIADYAITAEELGFTVKAAKGKAAKAAPVVKYRNPENHTETYGGKGPKPKWLDDAIKAGKTMDYFKVPEVAPAA